MANIFRLMKLARSAYKAAPVVIPIGLVVAKYAMNKLRNQGAGKARTQSSGGNEHPGSQDPVRNPQDQNERI